MKASDTAVIVEAIGPVMHELLAPITARLAALEKRLDDLPPGADAADLEVVRDLVLGLPGPEAVAAMIDKAVAARPAPKDGRDGEPGPPGPQGNDGVGLADAVIDKDGQLVVTRSDGTLKHLGLVVGRDGRPGFELEDFSVVNDGAEVIYRFVRGDVVKESRLPKATLADCYRGIWKEGDYKAGDAVTWAGSLFIARRDTGAKPESGDDWQLAVKRGRDGKDGVLKASENPPVRLK